MLHAKRNKLVYFGVIQGKKATAFPGLSNELTEQSEVEKRVVVDGNLITSRAPGTALEFTLTMVEKLSGRKLGLEVATSMGFTSL